MHPRVMAQRTESAQKRIMDASGAVASRYGIPAPRASEGRYTDVNNMMTWENIATFLEALATASPGVKIDDVLAVEGLSQTAIKAIQKHFEVEPANGEPVENEADGADQQAATDGAKPTKKAQK